MISKKKNNKKNMHLTSTSTAIMIAILSLSLIFSNPIAFLSGGLQSADASIGVRALNGGTTGAELPRLSAVVSGDNIYIAWWTNSTENGNEEVMFRASTDAGAMFSDEINLSNTTDADSWRVEIAADGENVAVTWWETNQTSDIPVARISNDAGQTFGPILMLRADGTIGIEVEPEEPVDTTPPTVVSTEPDDDATDVPINTPITATFSEDVTGVDEDSFIVNNGTVNGTVQGEVTYNSATNTTTFTPSDELEDDTEYTGTLSSAIEDQAGNELEETDWSFTTITTAVEDEEQEQQQQQQQ